MWAEGALVNIDGNDSERLAVVLSETLSDSVDPDRSSQAAGYRYCPRTAATVWPDWGVNTKADCVDSLSAVRAGPPALPRPAYHQGDLLARLGGHHARTTHPVKLNTIGIIKCSFRLPMLALSLQENSVSFSIK